MPTLMTSLTNCTCSIDNYTVLTKGEPNDITITACAVQAKAQGTTITEADAFKDATFTK